MERHLQTAEFFAQLLDNKFQLFGVRFGINAILDIIPELGDFLAAALSFYLVWIALEIGMPKIKIAQMIWNIAINFFLGIIPVVGEITYIFRKANLKNFQIIKQYVEKNQLIEGKIVKPAI